MILEEFGEKARQLLIKYPGSHGREKLRELLEELLIDGQFVSAHFGPEESSPRKLLYEDPKLGFCVFSHVHQGANTSRPHDHGPSWAIYGQVHGITQMKEWVVEGETVRLKSTYRMEPGKAQVYNEGDIHSPSRDSETHLIRIEGKNLEGVPRAYYDEPGVG